MIIDLRNKSEVRWASVESRIDSMELSMSRYPSVPLDQLYSQTSTDDDELDNILQTRNKNQNQNNKPIVDTSGHAAMSQLRPASRDRTALNNRSILLNPHPDVTTSVTTSATSVPITPVNPVIVPKPTHTEYAIGLVPEYVPVDETIFADNGHKYHRRSTVLKLVDREVPPLIDTRSSPPDEVHKGTFKTAEKPRVGDEDDGYSTDTHHNHDMQGTNQQATRPTMMEQSMRLAQRAAKREVVYNTSPPMHKISLTSLTFRAILNFIDEVTMYHQTHKVLLPVASLISSEIIRELVSTWPGMTVFQFLQMSAVDVFKILQSELCPQSLMEFEKILRREAVFTMATVNESYKPNPVDYRPMYRAILRFKSEFLRVYEALAQNCEPSCIPECTNKDGGLINIFLQKIPYEHGTRLHKNYLVKVKHWNSIYDYLTAFSKLVVSVYAQSKVSRSFGLTFGGSQFHASRQSQLRPNTRNTAEHRQRFADAHGRHRQQLHAIVNGSEDPTLQEDNDITEEDIRVASEDYRCASIECDSETEDGANRYEMGQDIEEDPRGDNAFQPSSQLPDRETPDQLHALTRDQAPSRPKLIPRDKPPLAKSAPLNPSPKGCHSLVLYGFCKNRADCKFEHDEPTLAITRKWLIKRLTSSEQQHQDAPARNPPASMSTLYMLTMDTNPHSPVPPCLSLELPTARIIQDLFCQIVPDDALLTRAAYTSATVLVDGLSITVPSVLFDSGAIHSSYVSRQFLDRHRPTLQPHVTRCSGVVKLGDNHTTVQITELVSLDILFAAPQGGVHRAHICFCVLPSGVDMIVGLPDILSQLCDLHVQMIRTASGQLTHSLHALLPDKTNLLHPWNDAPLEDAPEDVNTPLPCSFSYALHYMEMSVEDARTEYFGMFDKHVAPEFAASTAVLELLRTKGLRVFVPTNWEGINGLDPLELKFKDTLPDSIRPRARPVSPKHLPAVKKEFERLRKVIYVPSTSPIASPVVVAPKATAPFVRICGDYTAVNKHMEIPKVPIPNVLHQLTKMVQFKIYLDLDWANAFHQVRLGERTSNILSLQTVWELVRPRFMPEGIGPASGILQAIVASLFSDFDEWIIAIFDNLLVLAHDYQDAYAKLEKILDRCIERNVFLKFSKSWLGFQQVKFFGYSCRNGSFGLSQDRVDQVRAIPFPRTRKQMQAFLGAALFFSHFVPNFASHSAPLNDMTRENFDWNQSNWTVDYAQCFENLKDQLQHSFDLYYPRYDLDWVMRTDASTLGVGAVLFQILPTDNPDEECVFQPIGFASQKFSPQATRWTTIEQEAYAIYFGVLHFSFYLHGKPFVLETDHANLQWIEKSNVPKIIRWRVYLQSFVFHIRHIAGKTNQLADFLSRMFEAPPQSTETLAALARDSPPPVISLSSKRSDRSKHKPEPPKTVDDAEPPVTISDSPTSVELVDTSPPEPVADNQRAPPTPQSTDPQHHTMEALQLSTPGVLPDNPAQVAAPEHNVVTIENAEDTIALPPMSRLDMLRAVHGGRSGHHGTRRTLKLLNYHFAGHGISAKEVEHFVMSCPICQKDRLGMLDVLDQRVLHLKPLHRRAMVGVDTLTLTPVDKYGNKYLTVVVVMDTKLCALYPSPTNDARSTALALFQFYTTYGTFDTIISDPGVEFDNAIVAHLHSWFGVLHRFSLVDRHESNGVEAHNKIVLRHIKALVMDERVSDRWSDKTILLLIQYIINSTYSSETGLVPFHAHFGSADATYFKMPASWDPATRATEYVRLLDDNLRTLREISDKHQKDIITKRQSAGPSPDKQNTYQPGDLILFQLNPSQPRPSKLTPKFAGPYEVISQDRNDVHCRHLVEGSIHVFHVSRVKRFFGSYEDARRMAMLDHEQFVVQSINAYKGDPAKRTTMSFEVLYEDGTLTWVPWDSDIDQTMLYEDFCRKHPQLQILLYPAKQTDKILAELRRQQITLVQPGQSFLVDLRSYGEEWYMDLNIPTPFHTTYLLQYDAIRWVNKTHTKLEVRSPVFKDGFVVANDFIYRYCRSFDDIRANDVLIDDAFCRQYPLILQHT